MKDFVPNPQNEIYNERYFDKLNLINQDSDFKQNLLKNFIKKMI